MQQWTSSAPRRTPISTHSTSAPSGPDESAILARFGIDASALLGSGGESRVFALDDRRVLRIFAGTFGEDDGSQRLVDLLDGFAGSDIGVVIPRVLDQGVIGRQRWTIDVRVPGESLATWLSRGQPDALRRRVLLANGEVAARLGRLSIGHSGFRALAIKDRVPPGASLVDLLRAQAAIGVRYSDGLLARALPDLDQRLGSLFAELTDRRVEPAFVHGDYFPGNVMVDGDRISGVVDFSVHALAADPVMDEVAAVCFLDQVSYPQAAEDIAWLEPQLRERLGDDAWLVSAYRRWYGVYYSMDHALIGWAVQQFARE